MDRIKALVVNEDLEERSGIVEIFSNVEYITVEGEAESSDEAMELIEELNPDVILIGAYIPGDGYKLAEKIFKTYPEKAIIIIERELREETMRKAIFSGARDVLIYPFTASKVVDSVYRCFQLEQKKQLIQRESVSKPRRRSHKGQVISVFSTKGGVGKTFFAANLAVALSQHTKEKVVLLDLDLDFGNAALALNIIPRYTVADIVNEIRNLDQDLIESYLIPHRSGIKVLPANAQPQMTEFIAGEHIEIIIKVLQSAFDYVVIDLPSRFSSSIDPAFQSADLLFLLTAPEVATVRNIKATLAALNDLSFPKQKIKLILNKEDSRTEIKPKDVEATLNSSLFGTIPADYKLVNSSLNKGIPVVLLYPRAKVSRVFNDLAGKIAVIRDQKDEPEKKPAS